MPVSISPRYICLFLTFIFLKKIPSDGFGAASKLQILDLSGTTGSLPENPAFSSLPELQELYLRFVCTVRVTICFLCTLKFTFLHDGQTDANISVSFGNNDFTTVTDS